MKANRTESYRETEPLPKVFESLKREFQKVENMYMARNRVVTEKAQTEWDEDKTDVPLESYALFWQMMQDFYKYLNEKESEIVEKMMSKIDTCKIKNSILLEKYGIKIIYDDDADWFFKQDLNSDDWKYIDKRDNENFLEKHKAN